LEILNYREIVQNKPVDWRWILVKATKTAEAVMKRKCGMGWVGVSIVRL
jgi:hypothetical protein